MSKKVLRITETDLHDIVRESVKKIIKESSNDFYDEEDITNAVGTEKSFRTYDTDGYTLEEAIEDAKENGYDSLEEYLEDFADDLSDTCEWCWGTDDDYIGGYKIIAQFDGWVVKEWGGQLIFDEYY